MPIGVSILYLEPGALYKVFPVRHEDGTFKQEQQQAGVIRLSHAF